MKVEPYITILEQIISGLNMFNLMKHIKEQADIFKFIFCDSPLLRWSYQGFMDCLTVNWSDNGSNRKVMELKTYKCFIDMCECSFFSGKCYFTSC